MADYSALHRDGETITRTTSGAVTGGQLLIVSGSGTVAASSAATHSWLGVAAFNAASGALVTVLRGGVQRLTASGGITAGNTVEAAASGAVAAHTNGTGDVNIVGVALTTATDGNLVEIALAR